MKMTSFAQLAAMAPANAQAATVTSGGEADGRLTIAQMRENLLPILWNLEAERTALDNSRRKVDAQIKEIQDKLSAWKQKERELGSKERRFYDLARKMLTAETFARLDKLATKAVDDANKRAAAEGI